MLKFSLVNSPYSDKLIQLIGDNLRRITSLDIQQMILAPGDIFWLRASGRKIKIAKAGQVIDSKIIQKFEGRDFEFDLDESFSLPEEVRQSLVEKFKKLKLEKLEMNRVNLVKEIITVLFVDYAGKVAFSDLIFIGLESFYGLDVEVTEELTNIDVRIFQRSSVLGIYSVLVAMITGYFEYEFLQDIYHLCFFFDCYFSLEQVSYYVTEALEKERQSGQGKSYLQEKVKELEDFEKHPEESFKLAKRKYKRFMNNKEVFQLIRLHHEKIDGSGFSNGYNDEDFTDIERIIIFLSESLPFGDLDLDKDKGKDFLMRNIVMGKGEMFLSPRISKILEESLSFFERNSGEAA